MDKPNEAERAVSDYLVALLLRQGSRGTSWTVERWERRAHNLRQLLGEEPDPERRLRYTQALLEASERHQEALRSREAAEGLLELQHRFEAVAAGWGRLQGIDWRAWRQVGVPAAVLRRAGIVEKRGPRVQADG